MCVCCSCVRMCEKVNKKGINRNTNLCEHSLTSHCVSRNIKTLLVGRKEGKTKGGCLLIQNVNGN